MRFITVHIDVYTGVWLAHTHRANALDVQYTKHLVKNVYTTVTHHVISIYIIHLAVMTIHTFV